MNIRINKWIPLTFCLPQKVHQWHLQGKIIEPEDIDRCLMSLKPYHSLLLLCPVQQIHSFLPLDGSPSLIRLLSQYSPLKNLQTLAADADLTLVHVRALSFYLNCIILYITIAGVSTDSAFSVLGKSYSNIPSMFNK